LTPIDLLVELFAEEPPGRTYVRGTPALIGYLESRGIEITGGPQADTVLLAFDRTMTYEALATAIAAVLDHGARLIATHENRIFRAAGGAVEPGLGPWVRAVEYATGARALITGKPARSYYLRALERLGSTAGSTTMISDDPFEDLAGARAIGMRTVFVLTGKYPDRRILDHQRQPPDEVYAAVEEVPLPPGRGR
jgi:NagD protein